METMIMMILGEEHVLEMLVIIQFRNCCHLVYFASHWRSGYKITNFTSCFVGV